MANYTVKYHVILVNYSAWTSNLSVLRFIVAFVVIFIDICRKKQKKILFCRYTYGAATIICVLYWFTNIYIHIFNICNDFV